MKQKTILKINKVQTRNTFGIVINKCCASCAHKDLTRAVTLRRCMKHRKEVRTIEVCKLWAMSQQLRMAGSTQGCVKRREYLMLLAAERETETLAEQAGRPVKPKSIAHIRALFEREHGSIYVDL